MKVILAVFFFLTVALSSCTYINSKRDMEELKEPLYEDGYKDGYRDGVIFSDTSGYKKGLYEGFQQGYEYSDSINSDLERARSSDNFDINTIYGELSNPKGFIQVTGEIDKKSLDKGSVVKYVEGYINNSALYARYNKVSIEASFKDNKKSLITKYAMDIPNILYPGKRVRFQISSKEVPVLTEYVEFSLEYAQGME